MSKNSINLSRGNLIFSDLISDSSAVPVSFVYDDVEYNGFKGLELISKTVKNNNAVLEYSLDGILIVKLVAKFCEEFGQVEYTVWFENVSNKPSKVLKNVYTLDKVFDGYQPVLRGCMGDHENFYSAYENDLTKGASFFEENHGRATHVVFPYFDLVHGDGGTMIALGWAGTWDAMFTCTDAERTTLVRAKTCRFFRAVLLPGEKIRTGLVVMLPYSGRNYDDASNLWREWYMKYNLPKADAEGNDLLPFSSSCWSNDTGRPNSDGSISEAYDTWQPTLKKILDEDVKLDFRWFDAGWYSDPAGNTVSEDWFGTIGSWERDRVKWPDNTMRESFDACHDEGIKVLCWFEPERVTHPDDLVKNYGYKKEWCVENGHVFTQNFGNPECLEWTLNRIIKMMDENGVDMYREDNNSDPGYSWGWLDDKDSEALGMPRYGIAENKGICGHYALWDGIIDYCRDNGKCTFVDSCASGGGRNDIESMRRGIPLMRSDFDRTTSSMRLSQTSTFCRWIPFHGSIVKETETQVGSSIGVGSTTYVNRASLLPIYNLWEAYTQNPKLDFDLMRKNLNEWKSVKHLLTRDFYVLTPWHHNLDTYGWSAFAYDAPDLGESILLAFRQENAEADTLICRLQFANEDEKYILKNADTNEERMVSGSKLRDGIEVTLLEKKSSALFRIKRV